MNKPFKPEYANIRWEYNNDLFTKWTQGQTGYPFIDAAMRQLNHTGYMHNRARMAVVRCQGVSSERRAALVRGALFCAHQQNVPQLLQR